MWSDIYFFFYQKISFFLIFFFCADWCDVSVFWSACQCCAARDSSTADLCEHLNTSGLLNNTLDLLLFYSTYPCYVLRDRECGHAAHTLTWFSLMMRSVFMGIPRNVCFFPFKKLIKVNVFFKICQTKNILSVNTALCHLKPKVCCYTLECFYKSDILRFYADISTYIQYSMYIAKNMGKIADVLENAYTVITHSKSWCKTLFTHISTGDSKGTLFVEWPFKHVVKLLLWFTGCVSKRSELST